MDEELRERLQMDRKIEEVIMEVVEIFLIPRFMSYGMEATGEWRENLRVEGNKLYGRKYTEQLEYGRRPGTYVPIEPLRKWAQAKFGMEYNAARSMAFAVSKKIYAEGTKWYKQGGTELMEVLESPEVDRYMKNQLGWHIRSTTEIYFSQVILAELKKADV